ncbi:MAG: arsenate reductase ArsC [Nitriliruptoraceae bacterium]
MDTAKPTVLFLCVHNAGRSQMAAAFTQKLGAGQITVLSGGSDPAVTVNPIAAQVMSEVGIDITTNTPARWTESDLHAADVIITMGCGDTCPVLPGKRYIDWPLDDPAGQDAAVVRTIRDAIEQRVRDLLQELSIDG